MDRIVLIHGDVTLKETKSIPETAKKVDWKKGFVLERGEGPHTHTIETECDIFIDEKSGRMYLRQKEDSIKINHEEHGLQTIQTGTGIVYKEIEREWDYEMEESRMTRD